MLRSQVEAGRKVHKGTWGHIHKHKGERWHFFSRFFSQHDESQQMSSLVEEWAEQPTWGPWNIFSVQGMKTENLKGLSASKKVIFASPLDFGTHWRGIFFLWRIFLPKGMRSRSLTNRVTNLREEIRSHFCPSPPPYSLSLSHTLSLWLTIFNKQGSVETWSNWVMAADLGQRVVTVSSRRRFALFHMG